MTGFRLPAPSDATDLALVPESGLLAAIVFEYLGIQGSYDAKWGEFDNRQPTYRAKLVVRAELPTRIAVAFGGKCRADIQEPESGQTYLFDLDFAVNSDDGDQLIRVLIEGKAYAVSVKNLWTSEDGVVKVGNLIR